VASKAVVVMAKRRRAAWTALVAFTLGVAGIASSGCGEDAGSQAFAGTQRAIAPGGAYSFRFLAPPWAPLSLAMGIYAVIDWDLALMLDLTKISSIDRLPVVLRVETISGSADAALAARMASLSPPVPSSDARTLGTAAGVHGREVSWRDDSVSPPIYWREGYFDGTAFGGKSFRMQFKGHQPVADDPLIESMLVSFGPGNTTP
jgi:hypothetical protein